MRILYRKAFKKLREEYKDLGETKLDLLEELASNYSQTMTSPRTLASHFEMELKDLDNTEIPRSFEYLMKYRTLLNKRFNARTGISAGVLTGFIAWLAKVCYDSDKETKAKWTEYDRVYKNGYDDGWNGAMTDIEETCANNRGLDTFIGDTVDGDQKMILRFEKNDIPE